MTALLAVATDIGEAERALAEGADLVDVSGCEAKAAAAIQTAHPDAVPTGPTGQASTAIEPGAVVDADPLAAACAGLDEPHSPGTAGSGAAQEAPVAAVIAVAAISTWLGAAAVRTRHVREVRRAIDMTSSIAGTRPPALTTRGLA